VTLAALVALAPAVALVPKPVSLQPSGGQLLLEASTKIVAPDGLPAARILQEAVVQAGGPRLEIVPRARGRAVRFQPDEEVGTPGTEGYKLSVTSGGATVRFESPAGALHAVQTIRQLLPATPSNGRLTLPGVQVTDYPRFGWRGLHLDVSRHFFGVEFIKRYIDWISMMKMNVFHWHLVDDGGWRMQVRKYPRLTDVGAWRIDTGGKWPGGDWNYANIRFCMKPEDGPRYGGFYTQDEIREVVRYASERNVTVVPEIELPGHSLAAIVAYPELGCEGMPEAPPGKSAGNALCAGNPKALRFLEEVLAETLELFPSQYIHIGADELDKRIWNKCPRCQAKRSELGLKDMDQLQSWMVRHFDAWLASRGRRLVGWDEILEGGLAPSATVMSWRGVAGGIEAAKMGRDVVMSPTSHCYFDYGYGTTSTEKVYSWEPVPPTLTPQEAKRVLGGQANVWTEFIATEERCEEMVFPRALAMAEVLWSPPTGRTWSEFEPRLSAVLPRLDAMGVRYHLSAPRASYDAVLLEPGKLAEVSVQGTANTPIYFTTDGTAPTTRSARYRSPVPVGKPKTLKFAHARADGSVAEVTTVEVRRAVVVRRRVCRHARRRQAHTGMVGPHQVSQQPRTRPAGAVPRRTERRPPH
jgi:hexosaminidase